MPFVLVELDEQDIKRALMEYAVTRVLKEGTATACCIARDEFSEDPRSSVSAARYSATISVTLTKGHPRKERPCT